MSSQHAARWVLVGAGGHARSVAEVIAGLGARVIAVSGTPRFGWQVPVLDTEGDAVELARSDSAVLGLGIGDNAARLRTLRSRIPESLAGTVIASSSTVSPSAVVGRGCVVLEHAHVGPESALGSAVIVNTAAVVEHHCRVGDGSHIAPGAVLLGAASVGELTFIGSGARVLPGIRVGAGATVGAGAVVVRDVPDGVTVCGVPARIAGPAAGDD